MRRLSCLFLLLGVMLCSPFTSSVRAASSAPMPRADYPFHARIQVFNPADNDTWTCGIAIDCDSGAAFVHSATGDDLGRVTGWALASSSHHKRLQFVTTANVFTTGLNPSGVQWNQAALDDETETMPSWKVAHPITLALPPLPEDARTLTFRITPTTKHDGLLFVSAAWGATSEVELLAAYRARYARQATRLILAQLRDAVAVAS